MCPEISGREGAAGAAGVSPVVTRTAVTFTLIELEEIVTEIGRIIIWRDVTGVIAFSCATVEGIITQMQFHLLLFLTRYM